MPLAPSSVRPLQKARECWTSPVSPICMMFFSEFDNLRLRLVLRPLNNENSRCNDSNLPAMPTAFCPPTAKSTIYSGASALACRRSSIDTSAIRHSQSDGRSPPTLISASLNTAFIIISILRSINFLLPQRELKNSPCQE